MTKNNHTKVGSYDRRDRISDPQDTQPRERSKPMGQAVPAGVYQPQQDRPPAPYQQVEVGEDERPHISIVDEPEKEGGEVGGEWGDMGKPDDFEEEEEDDGDREGQL